MKASTAQPTRSQLIVLRHLAAAIERDGWAPSMRELAASLGVRGPGTITRLLTGLDRRGLIVRGERRQHRALRITPRGKRALKARSA